MNEMAGFCASESEERNLICFLPDIRTSSQHALHKISNVTEDDPEAFCNALLTC